MNKTEKTKLDDIEASSILTSCWGESQWRSG